MEIHTKILAPVLVLLSLFLMAGQAFASEISVAITGTAFGDKIGLLHFDYTTAKKPINPVPAPPGSK